MWLGLFLREVIYQIPLTVRASEWVGVGKEWA